jgi:hypothetical protein
MRTPVPVIPLAAAKVIVVELLIAARVGRRVSGDLLPNGLKKFVRLKDVMRRVLRSTSLPNQPKYDESHEIVDESCIPRNLRTESGLAAVRIVPQLREHGPADRCIGVAPGTKGNHNKPSATMSDPIHSTYAISSGFSPRGSRDNSID